jgi:hypothetical protein
MKRAYEAPELSDLGSVEDLTLQILNKCGTKSDFLTALLPDLVGSIVNRICV